MDFKQLFIKIQKTIGNELLNLRTSNGFSCSYNSPIKSSRADKAIKARVARPRWPGL